VILWTSPSERRRTRPRRLCQAPRVSCGPAGVPLALFFRVRFIWFSLSVELLLKQGGAGSVPPEHPKRVCSSKFDQVSRGSLIRQERRVESSAPTTSRANSGGSGVVETRTYGCLIAGLQCPDRSCVSDQCVQPRGVLATQLRQQGGAIVRPAGEFANLERFLKIVHKRNSACCCIVDADFIWDLGRAYTQSRLVRRVHGKPP